MLIPKRAMSVHVDGNPKEIEMQEREVLCIDIKISWRRRCHTPESMLKSEAARLY